MTVPQSRSPQVSIIIPAFNAERFIGRALRSVIGQSYVDAFEIIVVDDCSTDRTAFALELFKGEITLLIGNSDEDPPERAAIGHPSVRQRMEQLMAEDKIDEKAALKRVAKERGVSKSEAYRQWQRNK